MGDDVMEMCDLCRLCCECGLCIALCCFCCKSNDSSAHPNQYYQSQPGYQPGYPPQPGYGQGSYGTNVTVVPPPVVNNPYPPHNQMPMGPGGPPQAGFVQMPMPHGPTGPHPTHPYPPGPGVTPYPPGGPAPYPPSSFGSEPPPYHVAVTQPPTHNPTATEAYGKQAPYNPSYNS